MKLIFYICAIAAIAGCYGLRTRSSSKPELSLLLAEGIEVGKTKKADVLLSLGKPDRLINLSQTDLNEHGEIWAYFAGGVQSEGRISVSFPANSELVDSVSWDVRDGDPEQSLENALARFKGTRFVRSLPKYWNNPHSSPDEVFYDDPKTGLTIIYLETPKRVTAISWGQPNRSTTSETDPVLSASHAYCIVGLCATPPKP